MTPPPPPLIDLDLWWLDLAHPDRARPDLAHLCAAPWLHEAEVARAHQLQHAPARVASLLTRALLRCALSARHPHIPPDAWALTPDADGKPTLASPLTPLTARLAFNVSHTDGAALVAIAAPSDPAASDDAAPCLPLAVGVDIERPRPLDAAGLARRFLSDAERAWMHATDPDDAPPDPLARFFTLWTLKEATLKATGQGLSGLSSLEVLPSDTPQPPDEQANERHAEVRILGRSRADGLHWWPRCGTRSMGRAGALAYAYAVCARAPFMVQARWRDGAATLGLAPSDLL